MKSHRVSAITFPAVCILLLLVGLFGGVSRAVETADANLVDVEVAKVAAEEMLPVFYEGNWQYFDHLVYYDLEGRPVTYAIVFQRVPQDTDETRESTAAEAVYSGGLESLEAGIVEMKELAAVLSDQIAQTEALSTLAGEDKALLTQELSEEKSLAQKVIYGMGEFATVVTGATEDMPPIVKCHEGLPLAFVKKTDAVTVAHERDPSGDWQMRRLMYLDRFTEAVEVALGPGGEGRNPVDEDSMVVNLRTRGMDRRLDLREKSIKAREERRLQRAESLNAQARELREKNRRGWKRWEQRVRLRDDALRGDESGTVSLGTVRSESRTVRREPDQRADQDPLMSSTEAQAEER